MFDVFYLLLLMQNVYPLPACQESRYAWRTSLGCKLSLKRTHVRVVSSGSPFIVNQSTPVSICEDELRVKRHKGKIEGLRKLRRVCTDVWLWCKKKFSSPGLPLCFFQSSRVNILEIVYCFSPGKHVLNRALCFDLVVRVNVSRAGLFNNNKCCWGALQGAILRFIYINVTK